MTTHNHPFAGRLLADVDPEAPKGGALLTLVAGVLIVLGAWGFFIAWLVARAT